MFADFSYESIALDKIDLDLKNPRLVTQKPLKTQDEIIKYLYDYDDLADFVKKIANEGRNIGAERPYVVKQKDRFIVVEGNSRIAAYKILAGLASPPKTYEGTVPHISKKNRDLLQEIECAIAPDRDRLLPIMANAHFGLGDKSKWGYLGSRKAIFDEYQAGKTIAQLAKAFGQTQGEVRDLILEFKLYQEAIKLRWTQEEKEKLVEPRIQFNPPVRFLQTSGHKKLTGISYDKTNLRIVFADAAAKKKFKHLIRKLVVSPEKGLGATATYDQVFADFQDRTKSADEEEKPQGGGDGKQGEDSDAGSGGNGSDGGKGPGTSSGGARRKSSALFNYVPRRNSALVVQLMKEAKSINANTYPAAATFLLRNIIEVILKEIIHDQDANRELKSLDLESALNLCLSREIRLHPDDKKIVKQIKQRNHLDYLNLGAHGTIVPNVEMVKIIRDNVDQFVKRNV